MLTAPATNRALQAGAVLAALLTVTACGHSATDAPPSAAAAGESACAKVDVPLLDVEARAGDEPRVRIPQPAGWERYTQMDSELIRAALVNKSLTADGFTPNVVYTLDKLPGAVNPQAALDSERDGLVKVGGATDLKVTPGTVCGLPAQTVHYTLAASGSVGRHPAILREAVVSSGDATYVVSLTIQSTKPDDATYKRDAVTILDGLQVLAPQ